MSNAQFIKLYQIGVRKLVCIVGQKDPTEPGLWMAMAVETNATTTAGVLEQHGHKDLGTFLTIPLALEAADAFGDGWAKGACECAEIPAAAAAGDEGEILSELD